METLWNYPFGVMDAATVILIIIAAAWSVVWKAIALWMAARRKQMAWFIIMVIINTAGILEIIYIFAVARRRQLQL